MEQLAKINAKYPDDFTQNLKLPGDDFYVDDDGVDQLRCGLTAANPCQTLAYLEYFRVLAGSTIHIGEGTYYWDPNLSLADQPNIMRVPANNITYSGEGPGLTVFEGTAEDGTLEGSYFLK